MTTVAARLKHGEDQLAMKLDNVEKPESTMSSGSVASPNTALALHALNSPKPYVDSTMVDLTLEDASTSLPPMPTRPAKRLKPTNKYKACPRKEQDPKP